MASRRDLLLLLAAGALPARLLAQAGARRRPLRIAMLSDGTLEQHKRYVDAFRLGLREHGYEEGRDYAIAFHWKGESIKPLRWLGWEAAAAEPDVIVATCEATAYVAQRASRSIPIVMAASSDPVAHRLVDSLARPGGNITGVSFNEIEVSLKRLEMLKEVVPGLRRAALLTLTDDPMSDFERDALQKLGSRLGVELVAYDVRGVRDFESAFARMPQEKIQGVLDFSSLIVTFPYRKEFAVLALKARLPVAYHLGEMVEAGGLMSYGPVVTEAFRRAASYVDRIARGSRPETLPIEQPSRFELVLNLGTARALGITLPQSLLLRADRVVE